MITKFKSIQKRKSLFLFIFPVLLFSMLGCSSSDDSEKVVEQNGIAGAYIGTWNSTTPSNSYVDYGISAKIKISSSNVATGIIYYTNRFVVCCSEGENDGTFTIEFDENVISSFRLDDVQTDCAGVFTGKGIVRKKDDALVIDFIGDDCRGDHVGQIILVKL